tara:strand:+ start:1753 stop:2430 length:678 start_codon:yes stop_codon:yes gene_type:complete
MQNRLEISYGMKKIFKVFVCCHKYIHRVKEIKARVDKWNLGDYLIFIGGEEEKQLEENVIQLKCRDLYEDLPEKMFAIYGYLADKGYADKYDFFWKIDDDIDFNIWNKEREIQLSNCLEGNYHGLKVLSKPGKRGWHIGRVREDSPWYNKRYNGRYVPWADGGSTYFLSSKSLKKWKNFYELSHIRLHHIYEDLAVALFLEKCGISPIEINPWPDKPVLKFNINR